MMHILVFYTNHKVTTGILGQLHFFQVLLLHKIKAGVQPKRKHMPCIEKHSEVWLYYLWGAKCTLRRATTKHLEPISIQMYEDC